MSNNGLLTIKEAVTFTGKSESILYRYIREGKLQVQTCSEQVQNKSSEQIQNSSEQVQCKLKTIRKLKKEELVKVFDIYRNNSSEQVQNKSSEQIQNSSEQIQNSSEQVQNRFRTEEEVNGIIEKVLSNHYSKLMKPIEEQALYRLGILENEVKHLQAEKETLRQENEILREQIKALPGPVESINQILIDKDNTLKVIQREKTEIEVKINTIQEEKEKALLELRTEFEQKLKQSEEEKELIAASWKKELEMAKKPWWKLW